MSMPREIPGYYYDAEKGKYFRIQPDHRAPPGAAHSSSAVAASKIATERADALTARQRREQVGRVKRISPSTYTNLNLQLRHGGHNSKGLLAQHYAASLQCRTAQADHDTFLEALTLNDGELYTAFRLENPDQIRFYWQNCFLSGRSQGVDLLYEVPHVRQRRPRIGVVEGGSRYLAAYIGSRLIFFNTWGQNVEYSGFTEMIWDIAGSRTSTVALATVNGLFIADAEEDNPTRPTGRPTEEQMAVAFQDPNIVMSGQRSGRINFTDIRAPGSVHRIQHSSAVNGITTARTANHIIVSGLLTTNMYDLRYTKAIDHSRSKKQRKQTKSQSDVPLSNPLVRFHVPDDRRSKSYGFGKPLGYQPSHDIAVVASHQASLARRPAQNKVTLYQASTGKILQSPLTSFQTSADIHDIAVGRVRDGPESIFVATSKTLFEWNADLPYDEIIKAGMGPGSPHPDWLDEWTYELGPDPDFFPPDTDRSDVVKEWRKGDKGPDA